MEKTFDRFLMAVMAIVVIGMWGGAFAVIKTMDAAANSKPEIVKIGDNCYKWSAKFCMRGIYLTYDQDLGTFKKDNPELTIVSAKITEYKDGGTPWRAIIRTRENRLPAKQKSGGGQL